MDVRLPGENKNSEKQRGTLKQKQPHTHTELLVVFYQMRSLLPRIGMLSFMETTTLPQGDKETNSHMPAYRVLRSGCYPKRKWDRDSPNVSLSFSRCVKYFNRCFSQRCAGHAKISDLWRQETTSDWQKGEKWEALSKKRR